MLSNRIFKSLFVAVFVASCVSGVCFGQDVFSYDFETTFPEFGFSFSFAGEGLPDCSPGPDGGPFITEVFDNTTGPTATSSLDTSNWMPDPGACYTFVGWGLGTGHVLGNQQLTSTDLSEYSITFDAWVEGTVPFLEMPFNLDFQGPDVDPNTGFPATHLSVGINGSVQASNLLLDVPQTFTFGLDELDVLSGDTSMLLGTTQIQLVTQPAGDANSVGLDNDNVFYLDNVTLTGPNEIVAPSCDLDESGVCDSDDADLLVADIVAGTNTYDLTGDGLANGDDLTEWLAVAGAENLASGNSYLLGDANLDGVVDGQDFIAWNGNKFTNAAAWSAGDFNADGVVDGQDFISWNGNKFMSADVAVPEPTTLGLFLFVGLAGGMLRRQ